MTRKLLAGAFVLALALAAGLGLMQAETTQAAGPPQIVSGFGEATIGGERTIVHVVVVVQPGQSGRAALEQALADHGARPFTAATFTFDGIVWDTLGGLGAGPEQGYNPLNQPIAIGGGDPKVGLAVLSATQVTWSGAGGSSFAFAGAVLTDRLPSLVKETPGRQFYDGYSDVAWMELKSRGTLAVTWFGTTRDEADIAINTKYNWVVAGAEGPLTSGFYDVETVLLHENGHVVGLGHSQIDVDGKPVMYPSYNSVKWTLHADDIAGVVALYAPVVTTTGWITGTVSDASGPIAQATVSTDSGESANTATDGSYTISNVPTGTRTVTASAAGYDSSSLQVAVSDGGTATADFALAETVGPLPVANVTVEIGPGSPFGNKDRVDIIVTALDANGDGVVGVAASVTLSTPKGRTLGASGTTGDGGVYATWYKVNTGRDGTGTYNVTATVDGEIGTAAFTVE